MSSVKITELTELLSASSANTILFATDLSVSPNVSHYIRVGTISSLTDYSIANAAFLKANTAYSTGFKANTALVVATIGFDQANAAYNKANSAYIQGSSAFIKANDSFVHANSAFNKANSTTIYATSGYTQANTATINSTLGYNKANDSFVHANSAFNLANTLNSGSTSSLAQSAFNKANTASSDASFAFAKANSAYTIGAAGLAHATGAYNVANTSVQRTGDNITGIVTSITAANNSSNTMIATTRYVDDAVKNAKVNQAVGIKAYAVVTIAGTVATLVRGFNIASVSRVALGRYSITFTTPMSGNEYAVTGAVSTYNTLAQQTAGSKNYDHTINIESTSTSSVVVDTGDPGLGPNNTAHDVYKIWIMVAE